MIYYLLSLIKMIKKIFQAAKNFSDDIIENRIQIEFFYKFKIQNNNFKLKKLSYKIVNTFINTLMQGQVEYYLISLKIYFQNFFLLIFFFFFYE